MKRAKRISCFIIAFSLILTIIPANVFASNNEYARPLDFEEEYAEALYELGLLKSGTSKDFALDRQVSRIEGLVMILRLTDTDANLIANTMSHPFKDVPDWASPYVSYAYNNEISSGISTTKFGTNSTMSSNQFLTLVLKTLGYIEGSDFTFANPYDLASNLGLLMWKTDASSRFLKGDCVTICYNALQLQVKDTDETLADKLIGLNVFTEDTYNKVISKTKDYVNYVKAYGLSNLNWHYNPTTQQEWDENFLIAYVTGNWEMNTTGDMPKHNWECIVASLAGNYCSILGEWLNCFACKAYYDNGFKIYTAKQDPVYTKEELIEHLNYNFDKVISLQEQFNITSEGLALVKDYYDKLVAFDKQNNFKPGTQGTFAKIFAASHPGENICSYLETHREFSIINMELDGVYGLLGLNQGECGPHAGTMNMFLNLEGIESYGLTGICIGAGGHIISCFRLNDELYVTDWLNQYGVCKLSDSKSGLNFEPNDCSFKNFSAILYK